MNLRFLKLWTLVFIALLLTGCQNKQTNDKTERTDEWQVNLQADYEYFNSIDFSDVTIYYDQNFFISEGLEEIDWYAVLEQNDVVYESVLDINYKYRKFDDSTVQFIDGEKSQLTIRYDDLYNPVVTKTIPIVYLDMSKKLDGTSSNIVPKIHDFTHDYITVEGKKYTFEFQTFEDGYYEVWFLHLSEDETEKIVYKGFRIADEDYRYKEKYLGPKTFDINGFPVVKVWKDKLGYRVDIINSDDSIQMEYYVYPIDMSRYQSAYFLFPSDKNLILREFYSDLSYEFDYHYDSSLQKVDLNINVYNKEGTITHSEIFTITDYYPNTFSRDDIDYDIEITRVNQQVINITFNHKLYEHYVFSYLLEIK